MTTKRLIRISYFTMLTVVGGLLKIPVGTIAFTFQCVFVILSAFVLGAKDGAFSQIAYAFIGLVGLPVFANGGGFSYVLQPSFGYIVGFTIGAFTTGKIFNLQKTLSTLKIWLSCIVGLCVIYIIGIVYQAVILITVNGLNFTAVLVSYVNVIIYFAVDVIIVYLIALIYPRLMSLTKIEKDKSEKVDNV